VSGGGSIFRKTPDIGLASYSIIPLRSSYSLCLLNCRLFLAANIGPRSGPGAGKKASYGSGKQTLRLRANGPAAVEEVDNVRTRAEESINTLLENFMGINDAELGACQQGFLILTEKIGPTALIKKKIKFSSYIRKF